MDTTKLTFSRSLTSEVSGNMIIEGLTFPRHKNFEPLGKLWANLRQKVFEKYGTDSVGIFSYFDDKNLTKGEFILNVGAIEDSELSINAYKALFTCHFEEQCDLLKEVVCQFIEAKENGYADYLTLLELDDGSADFSEHLEKLFDDFLVSIGMKKKKSTPPKPKSGKTGTPPRGPKK